MANQNDFEKAFSFTVGEEGAFDKSLEDRGNWTSGIVGQGELKGTKFGISAASYPNLDIENITLDQAKTIYLANYWTKLNASYFPGSIAGALFDTAVNQGPEKAIKLMQMCINTEADGKFGPYSQVAFTHALEVLGENGILAAFIAARQTDYANDSEWSVDGRGWILRTTSYITQWKNGVLNASQS